MGRWRVWSGSADPACCCLLWRLRCSTTPDNQYHWRDVVLQVRQMSPLTLLLALAATALSYGLLTLYDTLAVRQVGTDLSQDSPHLLCCLHLLQIPSALPS